VANERLKLFGAFPTLLKALGGFYGPFTTGEKTSRNCGDAFQPGKEASSNSLALFTRL
jgi:hypothetical protein